jgi:hypothetical protein
MKYLIGYQDPFYKENPLKIKKLKKLSLTIDQISDLRKSGENIEVKNLYPMKKLRISENVTSSEKKTRFIYSIIASSGAGKTFLCAQLSVIYKSLKNCFSDKNNKKNSVIFISPISESKYLSKGIWRHLTPEKLNEDLGDENIEEFMESYCSGKLIIFDDTESIMSDKKYERVNLLRESILTKGRHFCISLIQTYHNSLSGKKYTNLTIESTGFFIFPNSNFINNKKFLKTRLDFSPNEADLFLKKYLDSRWIYINVNYPSYVIHKNGVDFL